ncbi:MAG: DUF411 domain-containing protein [Candidatus Nanoarchaeia archaeon]
MDKVTKLGLVLLGILVIFLLYSSLSNVSAKPQVTAYKSANCGCCVGYIAELKRSGYEVKTIVTEDMKSIKDRYGIPRYMESCHTTILGDYFVEGHVPLEVLNILIEEQPEIEGIALPNMPSGSPGMPGKKTGTWTIYSSKNGEFSEFMTI